MNILLFDCKTLTSIVYSVVKSYFSTKPQYNPETENNKKFKFTNLDGFLAFFDKNRRQIQYTILIGSKSETSSLYEELRFEDDNVILCYNPEHNPTIQPSDKRETNTQSIEAILTQTLNDFASSINRTQQTYYQTIQKSIEHLESIIAKTQQGRPSPRSGNELNTINSVLGQLSTMLSKIDERTRETNYISKELYNLAPTEPNGNATVMKDLMDELGKYKNDFYLKVSQNGVNASIEMVSMLFEENFRLEQQEGLDSPSIERMRQMISFCLLKIKGLNVSIKQSNAGDAFDGNYMITYDDYIPAEQEALVGRVARSITPAFYWTLPRVNAPDSDHLLIKEEVVALYK